MPIKKETIPVPPWKGLYLDGVSVPGGMSKAENVIILADGTAERRPFERTLADTEACIASRGTKEVFELLKADGTRYIFADIDNSETTTSAFGAELIDNFASWTDPGAAWGYADSKWTHASGTTALTAIVGATPDVLPVIGTQYQIVADVTCPTPTPTTTTNYWTLTRVDSGSTYLTNTGATNKIWINTWTHTAHASDAVTPLTVPDFTPVVGASYVVSVYATHTSGDGVVVSIGGITLGTITSTGTHEYVARYCTSTAALKFTPATNWVGSISKSWPRVPSKVANWVSVKKLINPDGPNIPSNYDTTAGTYTPKKWYSNGAELTYYTPANWYAEATIYVGQSLTVAMGGVSQLAITESGVYTFDMTALSTASLTFTPTTAWAGSLNSCSVRSKTQGASLTKTKVIGGTVTGTTDYEVTWANILTDLTSGDTVHPSWTALQDRAFRVDGVNRNFWFENASTYHTLGCPAPDDAPVTANATTTGGAITAGTYNVYYTYVKKYGSGASQYVVEGNPSPASNVTVANDSITCAVVACTETDVTHIRIYRTLYGEPGSFAYFDQEVANATATITLLATDDEIRDTLSTLEFNHDMPPQGDFVCGAGSRLWLIDTVGDIHWSKLDEPEIMPSMNYMTFDPKDGDQVTGMCPLRKHLLVFKRRRTWLLDMFSENVSEDGTASLAKDVVSTTLGCIATGSIQSVGTDSAIWLSHAGFILYNGGTIKNISAGDPASGTPSRIQTVINAFMAAGAEHFIDSAYHTARQLYHVNFLTRNSAGTLITEQRHFVYNLLTDTWTEYVYRNSAGTKMYETNFAMAHDSLGNEVILIPYLATTSGELTYVYQGEYDHAPASTINYTEILTSAGADGTACNAPLISIVDDSDNVYVSTGTVVFKITSAGTKSVFVSNATLISAVGAEVSDIILLYLNEIVSDVDHDFIYIRGYGYTADRSNKFSYIIQSDMSGTCVLIATRTYTNPDLGCEHQIGNLIEHCAVGADGTLFYINEELLGNTLDWDTPKTLRKVVTPGATQTDSLYYDFGAVRPSGNIIYRFSRYGNNLYYVCYDAAVNPGNYLITKFTDITGTASVSYIDTGIQSASPTAYVGIIAVSDTEIYILYYSTPNYVVVKFTYSGSSWQSENVITLDPSGSIHGFSSFIRNTDGEFIISPDDTIYWYASDFSLKKTIAISGLVFPCGATHLIGTSEDEQTIIVCGQSSDNVYKISPILLVLADDEPTMKNTRIDIVSNYVDLGISNEKRVSRAYLDIDCKYPGCGSFSLEPDFNVNYTTHAVGETTEPTGATSLRPFQHVGHQTWVYTNTQFDSDVEQWQSTRLDVGAKGTAFRYSIRAGDVAANVTGTMRIRPPKLECQILPKQ